MTAEATKRVHQMQPHDLAVVVSVGIQKDLQQVDGGDGDDRGDDLDLELTKEGNLVVRIAGLVETADEILVA